MIALWVQTPSAGLRHPSFKTTVVFSYAIRSRKLSANEQFFGGAQTVVSLLQTTEIKQSVSFIAATKFTPALASMGAEQARVFIALISLQLSPSSKEYNKIRGPFCGTMGKAVHIVSIHKVKNHLLEKAYDRSA